MSNVKPPPPSLHAGARAVTSAYSLSSLIDYGNERAAERDAFWKGEIARLMNEDGAHSDERLSATVADYCNERRIAGFGVTLPDGMIVLAGSRDTVLSLMPTAK